MTSKNYQLAARLRRAAQILRDLGGEEEYDAADACEEMSTTLLMLARTLTTDSEVSR